MWGVAERMLLLDPRIQCAVMFGRSRTRNGVLIEPAAACHFDVADETAREAYIDSIWYALSLPLIFSFSPSAVSLTRWPQAHHRARQRLRAPALPALP